jgi:hypothetical protein
MSAATSAFGTKRTCRNGRLMSALGGEADVRQPGRDVRVGPKGDIRDGQRISFGSLFIANPDLPVRFANGWPLAAPDRATFYGGTERGYTDYPKYK